MKPIDLTGQRIGRLTVVKRVGSRWGKALWSCDCDCGTKGYEATQNMLGRSTHSCGCLRDEFLNLGPRRASLPMYRPRTVEITYPIPDIYPAKPLINEIARRRYQFRWERVELEAQRIERGTWKEPVHTPFIPRDDYGRRIPPLDLKGMMKARREAWKDTLRVSLPEAPASFCTGSSLADRVRVVSDEEWARL